MFLVTSESNYFNDTVKTALIRMNKFQLFDSVKINEAIALSNGGTASEGTVGAIVEIFNEETKPT